MPKENIVSKNKRGGAALYKFGTDDECLCQTFWSRLRRIRERSLRADPLRRSRLGAGCAPVCAWRRTNEGAGSRPRLNPVNIDPKNGAAAQKRSL
jgi:hypothetical protein